ncbi:hypothetical protein [Leifsonia sp. NPDC058248]|uniref:hypothetical protein n=1 Tax=Leifsonia sp. NPDC058248 TaxID=3346402 RepID=UPI0036DCA213
MVSALTAAYQHQLKVTRTTVGDLVARQWADLGAYNEADVPRFLERAVPIVTAGQARAVALTSAYLARKLGQAPVGLDVQAAQGANVRNGVAPGAVYRRPFVKVWTALADGDDWEDAVTMGGNVAQSSSLMDIALAARTALTLFGRQSGGEIVAWRRVAEPGCCDFCQSIDGAYTGPDEPQPLHNRCGCTADPVVRQSTAEENSTFLTPGRTFGDASIHEHGELGPVIGQKGDHFTGPSEIPAAA